MKKIETGIPSFDNISGGGLPSPSAISLAGNVGTIKETFVRQMVWNFLQREFKVLYFSVSQSAEDLRNDMNRFNWDVTQYEEKDQFRIEDVFTSSAERITEEYENEISNPPNDKISNLTGKELYDTNKIVLAGMKFMPVIPNSSKPRIVVFDSLSPIISANPKDALKLIHSCRFASRLAKAIGIGLLHTNIHDKAIEEEVKSVADVIIEVNESQNGVNTISLPRYVGEYKKGPFPIEVNSEGINLIPIMMAEFLPRENNLRENKIDA